MGAVLWFERHFSSFKKNKFCAVSVLGAKRATLM